MKSVSVPLPGPVRTVASTPALTIAATPTRTPRRDVRYASGSGSSRITRGAPRGMYATTKAMTTVKAVALPASLTAGVVKVLTMTTRAHVRAAARASGWSRAAARPRGPA